MEGSPVATTIWGPWNEPYLRDLQGTSFVFDNNTDANAAIANKRMYIANKNVTTQFLKNSIGIQFFLCCCAAEPTCETKVRKIRGQRDIELENRRFAGEEEMAQKRLDRDAEIAGITKQEREQLGKLRTEKTKELEGVLEQQGGENRKKLALVLS